MTVTSQVGLLRQEGVAAITRDSCATLLEGYGLSPSDWWDEHLAVEPGQRLTLDGTASSPLFRRILRTDDMEQFKCWIGVSNAQIRSGRFLPPPEFPQTAARRLEQAKEDLEHNELADLKRAYNYFFFGNSELVEDYRSALRLHYAPFEAALYAGKTVEIFPDASIEVISRPAIVLFGKLIIHQGGNLKLLTPVKVNLDNLTKIAE